MSLLISNWAAILILATPLQLAALGLSCQEAADSFNARFPEKNQWGEPKVHAFCANMGSKDEKRGPK